MAAEMPELSQLSADAAYAALHGWLESSDAIKYLEENSRGDSLPEEPLRLLKALPDPAGATLAEMRMVFQEVLSGHLEYFYSASDGRAAMADYARIGISALDVERNGWEGLERLIQSPMLPLALHPEEAFNVYVQTRGSEEPVAALDALTRAYERFSRPIGSHVWQPLLDRAASQTASAPGQWGPAFTEAMERLLMQTDRLGQKDDLDAYLRMYHELEPELADIGAKAARPNMKMEEGIQADTEFTASENAVPGEEPAQPEPVDSAEPLLTANLAPPYLTDALGTETSLEEAKLGIEPDVRAISTVMMNESWEPPLAIGLFGRWGAGKSFFMNQLHWQVRRLAAASRRAARQGNPGPLCRRPVQVTFNAWHYIDANLWASLVARIFDRLAEDMASGRDAAAEKDALVEKLKTFQSLKDEIEQRRERTAAELKQAQARAHRARTRVQVAEELLDAAESLGITGGEECNRLAATLQKNLGAVRALLSSRAGQARLVLIGLVALLYFFGIDTERLTEQANTLLNWASGLLAAIPAWQLFQRQQHLHAAAAKVGRALKREAAPGEPAEAAAAVSAFPLFDPGDAIETANRLQQDLTRIATEEAELTERYEQIQREIEELSPRRQLDKLVEERAGAQSTYRQAQGLVAMIREDFRDLEDTLERLHREKRAASQRGSATGAAGEAPPPAEAEDFPIDRIILYIDDLDRCPADRVAEVLQAVHLLLGFRIFVVVVAVDPRWLLASLRKRYPELLTNVLKDQSSSATPRDYLEKIFQVPYTIPLMRAEDSLEYMDYLLSHQRTAHPEAASEPACPDTTSGSESEAPTSVVPGSDSTVPLSGEPATDNQPPRSPAPTDASTRGRADPGGDEDRGAALADPDEALAAGVDASPATLELTETEMRLIKAIGPIFRTPRAGKRFVNVYRILRATVELKDSALKSYEENNCHGVLLLLASVLEYPEVGVYLLRSVRRCDESQLWSDYIGGLEPADLPGLSSTETWQLARLQERTADLGDIGKARMTGLRTWAERVGRYTFGD